MIPTFTPMPLVRARQPFDHPEWEFELKYDGFRALAFVNGGGTKLVSRRGLDYRRFEDLRSEINADDVVLDGENVRLDSEGRPIFIDLMRRRGPFVFVAFDCLALNGRDVRRLPLLESPISGTYTRAQLSPFMSRVMELCGGTFRESVVDVVANDHCGLVLAKHEFERKGKKCAYGTAHIYRIEDGKLAEFREYPEDLYGYDEAWS
jgi:hypothetical protein